MKRAKFLVTVFAVLSVVSIAPGQTFFEDFESYDTGPIVGQGGWDGWDGDAAAGAPVSEAQAFGGTKSIEIVSASDLVHTYDHAGGKWVFTAMQYIPSGGTGQTYFILLNQYGGGNDWSIQTNYNLATGAIKTWTGDVDETVRFDQWVELKYIIDLDENTVVEYYDGVEIDTRVWDNDAHGTIGAIDLYGNSASSVYYDDIKLQSYLMTLTRAASPVPAASSDDVPRDGPLTWTPGVFAARHNVYFGTDYDAVANDTAPAASGLTINSFDPGRLEFGQTYYWRVDEVNAAPDNTTFTGDVWSFTAEPYSVAIPADSIVATASSSANEFSPPERTVSGSGLDGDAHSISPETMWFSANVDLAPWLQYEFDGVKKLDSMKVWNSNGAAEMALGWGVKDVEVAYSVDGENWDVIEGITQFSRAPGVATYDQYDDIALDGVAAKFVRFNIASNWGGILMSYSLSEVQFNMIPAAARTPDPTDGATDVVPDAVTTWRAGRGAAQHTIYVSTDQNEVADGTAASATSHTNSVDMTPFDLQMETTYYWRVDEVNETEPVSVWPGPAWRFTTAAALTVDDFESYGNASPDRPFQAWLDGFGYSADDYFAVGYPGNNTGAGIRHDVWSLSSPHYDGDIMETTSAIPGSTQSMPFYYTNSGGTVSETQRIFAVPQDWTVGGVQTLSIAFRGGDGNTGTLYVKINDEKIPYARDASNIGHGAWQAWNIDLTAVATNLQSVTELAIGVDGANASGMVLIDDIKLYAVPGEVITPVDPGTANLAGEWNFDEGSGAVAGDSSGNGNVGTIEGGTPAWAPGKQGTALNMGTTTYVNVPAGAWSSVGAELTVSFWANGDAQLGNNWAFFAGDAGGRIVSCHIPWGNDAIFDTTPGWSTERVIVPSSPDALRSQWHHWIFVRNSTTGEKMIYLDGTLYGSAVPSETPISGVDRFYIGSGDNGGSPYVGLMDEVKLYDRALSEEEILWLAGVQAPIDKPF